MIFWEGISVKMSYIKIEYLKNNEMMTDYVVMAD